jgi:hypothetical protein
VSRFWAARRYTFTPPFTYETYIFTFDISDISGNRINGNKMPAIYFMEASLLLARTLPPSVLVATETFLIGFLAEAR